MGMIGISRQFILLATLFLSVGSPLSAMQEMSPQEAQHMQTKYLCEEQIAQSFDKMWERVRVLVMLWCGVAGYDKISAEFSDAGYTIKGHTRGACVFGTLGLIVTLRELIAMVGDLRKVAEAKQIIALIHKQLDKLEEDRRSARRPAKLSVVKKQAE